MGIQPQFMERCLQLAALGAGQVAPNPMVGCVITHQGNIIGEGYHQQFGGPHAEVRAIDSVSPQHRPLLKQSTLYVNLEPCSHHGKTPPCSHLIVKHQIPNVAIASNDPNPQVAGNGIAFLKENCTSVSLGAMQQEALWLNRRFYTFHQKKRPYVILKWAQTTDGFAGKKNERVIITNDRVQRMVHQWRAEEAAIMVGTQTALTDNPRLDARLATGKNPLRIVIDRQLKIPKTHFLLDHSTPTWVITEKKRGTEENLEYIQLPFDKELIPACLALLYNNGITSLIVEGGPTLQGHFIDQGLWDEARILTGGKMLGKGVAAPVASGETIAQTAIAGDRLTILKNPAPLKLA